MRKRRLDLNLTKEQVAARAGCSMQQVWLLETGRQRTTNVDLARRLAEALDTTIDHLWPMAKEGAA